MSDTTPRNPVAAPQMLADALLRSVAGSAALLRLTTATTDTSQSELGITATSFAQVSIGPVVMRKLRPWQKEGDEARWELLVSATSIQQQVSAFNLASAQALFAATLAVTITGQDYLIEAVSSNEAFGNIYLYRLLLREARPQGLTIAG